MSENNSEFLPVIPQQEEGSLLSSGEEKTDFPIISLPLNISDRERAWFEERKKKNPKVFIVPEIGKSNEPDAEDLGEFLKDPSRLARLIVCPEVNIDLTDDLGMFGTEPGYLFVTDRKKTTRDTISEDMFANGAHSMIETPYGVVPIIEHYDYFPRFQYGAQIVTPQRAPRTFHFLNRYLGVTDPRFRQAEVVQDPNEPTEVPSNPQLPPSHPSRLQSLLERFKKE